MGSIVKNGTDQIKAKKASKVPSPPAAAPSPAPPLAPTSARGNETRASDETRVGTRIRSIGTRAEPVFLQPTAQPLSAATMGADSVEADKAAVAKKPEGEEATEALKKEEVEKKEVEKKEVERRQQEAAAAKEREENSAAVAAAALKEEVEEKEVESRRQEAAAAKEREEKLGEEAAAALKKVEENKKMQIETEIKTKLGSAAPPASSRGDQVSPPEPTLETSTQEAPRPATKLDELVRARANMAQEAAKGDAVGAQTAEEQKEGAAEDGVGDVVFVTLPSGKKVAVCFPRPCPPARARARGLVCDTQAVRNHVQVPKTTKRTTTLARASEIKKQDPPPPPPLPESSPTDQK